MALLTISMIYFRSKLNREQRGILFPKENLMIIHIALFAAMYVDQVAIDILSYLYQKNYAEIQASPTKGC